MYPYPMPPFAPPPRRSNAGLWWFLGIVGAITAVLTVILAVSAANSPEWEDCVADAHYVAPA